MSLYNAMHGVNQSTFFVLPVLGKHPEEYPRFRDCFLGDDEMPNTEGKIIVYTRTGGGNREHYESENADIESMDDFLFDYDDPFDSTFACWVFDIPSKWETDVKKVLDGNILEASNNYKKMIIATFPKIQDKLTEMLKPE